jgi:hypothetical protein
MDYQVPLKIVVELGDRKVTKAKHSGRARITARVELDRLQIDVELHGGSPAQVLPVNFVAPIYRAIEEEIRQIADRFGMLAVFVVLPPQAQSGVWPGIKGLGNSIHRSTGADIFYAKS